jgi:HNH endonuclease
VRHDAIPENVVRRPDAEGGCWEWAGRRDARNYGRVQFAGRDQLAHRVVWELTFGPPAAGLVVMHRCDNPPCCRPSHLRLGTQAENIADMDAKGRARRHALGERQRAKTHCPHGHAYTADNILWRRGARQCRECNRIACRGRAGSHKRAAARIATATDSLGGTDGG